MDWIKQIITQTCKIKDKIILIINLQIKLMVTKMGKIIINLNIRIKQIIVTL